MSMFGVDGKVKNDKVIRASACQFSHLKDQFFLEEYLFPSSIDVLIRLLCLWQLIVSFGNLKYVLKINT